MKENEIELIEESWDFILMNVEDAGEVFYQILFDKNPSVQAMFKTDVKEQARKLVSMITFCVNKLRNLDEAIKEIEALGMRHNKYQVNEDHYPLVGEALVQTLKIGAGSQWTVETENAWIKLYGMLSGVMINASKNN